MVGRGRLLYAQCAGLPVLLSLREVGRDREDRYVSLYALMMFCFCLLFSSVSFIMRY